MIKKISQLNAFQFTVIGILAIIAGFSLWSLVRADGTEISMCVKQSGVSYVIGTGFANQSCKSNEQLLTFNIQGPQGPQGIQGPIGPQGPEGGSVKVYDANDVMIGYVTSSAGVFSGTGHAMVEMFDKNLGVFVVAGNYESPIDAYVTTVANSPGGSSVYYESLNCTGQGYMIGLPSIAKDSLLSNGSGNYAVDETVAAPDYVDYQSTGGAVPAAGPCIAESGTISSPTPVRDAQVIIDSYARPFRIGL